MRAPRCVTCATCAVIGFGLGMLVMLAGVVALWIALT